MKNEATEGFSTFIINLDLKKSGHKQIHRMGQK